MPRRSFLKSTIEFCIFIISAVSSLFFLYLYPFSKKKNLPKLIYAADVGELSTLYPKRKNITFDSPYGQKQLPVFLILSNNTVKAFLAYCTHLGCLTIWDNNQKRIICPCHAGAYSIYGDVLSGPPPKPLHNLPIDVQMDKIYLKLNDAI